MKTYEVFTGDELVIAELIQQRRYQILIHSCIYYKLNQNIISDRQWDMWAKELKALQEQYPNVSQKVTLYEYFKDWDASTGAFLPLSLDWVMRKAQSFVSNKQTVKTQSVDTKPKTKKRSLF